jgi:hypothetical protein
MSDTPIINVIQPATKVVNISVNPSTPRVVNIQINQSNRVLSVNAKVGNVILNKNDIGLGNVENISILSTSGYLQAEINNINSESGLYYLNTNPSGFITGVTLTGYVQKSQTGAFYSATNPSGFVTGVDLSNYALKSQTGQFVTSAQTGAFYSTSNPSGFITGISLTGYVQKLQTGAFYAANNPSGFITGVDLTAYVLNANTGKFITNAQTGAFYPASNPNHYITGVDLSSYITTGQTGAFASAFPTGQFITTGQTGRFYTNNNPSGYITGIDLSSYALKSQTGQFVTISNAAFTVRPTVNGTGVLLSGDIPYVQTNSYFYVDATRTDSYIENGNILYPYKTLSGAYNAAKNIAYFHNPTYITLLSPIAENLTIDKGYINLVGNNTNKNDPIRITGSLVFAATGIGSTITDNNFSIAGLGVTATSNNKCILFSGNNPQRLFIQDCWLIAKDNGTCLYSNNTNTTSRLQGDILKLSPEGVNTTAIDIVSGTSSISFAETSSSASVLAYVRNNSTLNISNSQIETTGAKAFQVENTARLTLLNSVLTNTANPSTGIFLKDAFSTAVVVGSAISVPANANSYAINGVANSYLFYKNLYFSIDAIGGSTESKIGNNVNKNLINSYDAVVYSIGDQTISGVKTFDVFPIVSGNKLITGVDLSSYATTANLASTGSTLNNSISSLSGTLTGYVLKSQTGSFVTTAQTGQFVSTAQTGAFYATSNPSGFITGYQSNNGKIGVNQVPYYFDFDSVSIGNSYGGFGVGAAGNVSIYPNNNLLLNPVGKVGIQNSSPVYDLDVVGSGNFSSGIQVKGQNVYTTKVPDYDTISVTQTDVSDNPLQFTMYYNSAIVGYFNQTFSGSLVTQSVLLDANSATLNTWNITYDASGKFLSSIKS